MNFKRSKSITDQKASTSNVCFENFEERINFDSELLRSLRFFFIKCKDKENSLKIVEEVSKLRSPLNDEQGVKLVLTLIGYDITNWCSQPKDSEKVIEELLEKMSMVEVYDFLEEVSEDGKPLSVSQWKEYLDSYENYSKMPVMFWSQLILEEDEENDEENDTSDTA